MHSIGIVAFVYKLFLCLFVYLFICLFVYLFICLFVYLFINPRKRYSKVTSNTGIVITPQTIVMNDVRIKNMI
jgi:predicted membrane metal-binding protein